MIWDEIYEFFMITRFYLQITVIICIFVEYNVKKFEDLIFKQ